MSSSSTYFSGLNYTLANEDTALEMALLTEGCDTVLTIAGSGGRVLPLLAKKPRRVICVDLSQQQLHLTELRLALAREAPLEVFLAFMGYPHEHAPDEREAAMLRRKWIEDLAMSREAREFLRQWLAYLDWGAPLYDGKWERTFARLSRVTRSILGDACEELMECRTLEQQTRYLRNGFPRLRWELVLSLLGNASVFNALLYKGSFPIKNIPGSRRRFYSSRYSRLFATSLARENFFLQLTFLGALRHPEGNPIECRPDVYSAAQAALQEAEIVLEKGDAVSVIALQGRRPVEFLSFSDVPSYFSGDLERNFLQAIRPGLASGAKVVLRHYLHVPEGCDRAGYRDETAAHLGPILAEKVGVYDVEVLAHEAAGR
jgi:S-adenosylmethionine-diacylglycerol 3-amino-3-carboxypropyl transferase